MSMPVGSLAVLSSLLEALIELGEHYELELSLFSDRFIYMRSKFRTILSQKAQNSSDRIEIRN